MVHHGKLQECVKYIKNVKSRFDYISLLLRTYNKILIKFFIILHFALKELILIEIVHRSKVKERAKYVTPAGIFMKGIGWV